MNAHLEPLESQAAGHPNSIFRDTVAVGRVWKPVSARERLFYAEASQRSEWQSFLPRYHGASDDESMIALQDLTHQYRQPCVLDLKVGLCTAGEDASEAKRANMRAKDATTTTHTLGLRICGMRVFDPTAQQHVVFGKPWGKRLTADTFQSGLMNFFTPAQRHTPLLVKLFVERVEELLSHMLSQTAYRFYSSSLLLVYEGDPDLAAAQPRITLSMIDMAHVYPWRDDHVGDNGYAAALQHLRHALVSIHHGVFSD